MKHTQNDKIKLDNFWEIIKSKKLEVKKEEEKLHKQWRGLEEDKHVASIKQKKSNQSSSRSTLVGPTYPLYIFITHFIKKHFHYQNFFFFPWPLTPENLETIKEEE